MVTYRYLTHGLVALLFLFSSSIGFAAEKYGPTKSSESLWQIAKGLNYGDSVRTVQVVYSIYKLNPNAFNSGNMNELKKGVYLNLPKNAEGVARFSYKESRKAYRDHLNKLDQLESSAKDLAYAKSRYSRWKRTYEKTRSRLRSREDLSRRQKAKLESRLKTAVRKQAKWKKQIRQLRKKVLAQATSDQVSKKQTSEEQLTVPMATTAEVTIEPPSNTQTPDTSSTNTTSEPSVTDKLADSGERTVTLSQLSVENASLKAKLSQLEERVSDITLRYKTESATQDKQVSVLKEELDTVKNQLDEKLKSQGKMEERLAVLEGELGDKEQVILKLQSTLRTASDTMKQQQAENDRLQARLTELEGENTTIASTKRLELMGTKTNEVAKPNAEVGGALLLGNLDAATSVDKVSVDPIIDETGAKPTVLATMEQQQPNILYLFVTLVALTMILSFLLLLLYRNYKERKLRERMKVVELKLKPVVDTRKKKTNDFKKRKVG